MAQTKWCCRIFPVVLILISAIIAAGIWYFDESAHTFAFLSSRDEFITYLGATFSIALIPIGIFYLLNDREKYASRARLLALLGFLPALGFLVFLIA